MPSGSGALTAQAYLAALFEMETQNLSKASIFERGLAKMNEIAEQTVKIARDDPRRLIHSLKVGLAVTIVSLFYYLRPFYNNFGVSAMWAVMTVVVIFEFSVGATLGKGLNRGLATFVAGALGIGAHHLAILTGKTGEPILIALFVFLLAVPSTFIRFFPKVKARYDYGMLIFILTFCFVSISGFRTDEVLSMAKTRLVTILIGGSICVIVSIFVCPVWAGEDLHKLIARNLDELGSFMEVFAECLRVSEQTQTGSAKQSVSTFNSILVDSKSMEETLANFARWEPGHGRFMYRHPWKQYLKIGHLTRQYGYRLEALNSFSTSRTQAQQEIRLQGVIQEAFSSMSYESGKVLRGLALDIKTMTKPSSMNPHMTKLKTAAKNMKILLKSDTLEDHYSNLLQMMPFAAVASLLIETVTCVESIGDAVNELSVLAKFKCRESSGVEGEMVSANNKNAQVIHIGEIPSISITIDEETKGQRSS